MGTQYEFPLTGELLRIEREINEKIGAMGGAQEFFGTGHGLNVGMLMSSWVEREIISHERRLGVKIDYTIESLPGGETRLALKGAGADSCKPR
jgi:hypothetical protein